MRRRSPLLPRILLNHSLLSTPAIFQGAAVGAGGALAMTTLVGVAAVVGMSLQGLSPEAMLYSLQHGMEFRGFVAAAEWLTAMAGGYAAVRIARRRPMIHAGWTAGATILLKCITWQLLGCPWPAPKAAIDLALVIPCALVGGYLASPPSPRAREATRASPSR